MNLPPHKIKSFQAFIWHFYYEQGRNFAWRNVDDPYKVVVSEIMLQQTQTHRVEQKYDQFITVFPDFNSLSKASLRDVLCLWQGLGYNRRGRFLHQIAQKVIHEYHGELPQSPDILVTFPGIGKATASSICAFAFNKSTVFIETNIRAVFINSFFREREEVYDKELSPLIEATLDTSNPREWYYALMDYGSFLKKRVANPSRKSVHHIKQSKFEGSDRQIRGMIIKLLVQHEKLDLISIIKHTKKESLKVQNIVDQLCKEGLIQSENGLFYIV